MWQTLLHTPWVVGAVNGALGAAAADLHAFKTWKSYHDAATYDWGTASWRWLQGAVLGAVSGFGLGALIG